MDKPDFSEERVAACSLFEFGETCDSRGPKPRFFFGVKDREGGDVVPASWAIDAPLRRCIRPEICELFIGVGCIDHLFADRQVCRRPEAYPPFL
jgi:hypothetical protein